MHRDSLFLMSTLMGPLVILYASALMCDYLIYVYID